MVVQSISSVYFPQFIEPVRKLESAADQYVVWIYQAKQKRLSNDPNFYSGYEAAYEPYGQKREVLLDALKKFASKHFCNRPLVFGGRIVDVAPLSLRLVCYFAALSNASSAHPAHQALGSDRTLSGIDHR
jgi:hypothetical protein